MEKEYDRIKAVDYAKEWALKRNPNYYDFSGIGGDCTNFISQCLVAGGGVFNFDYVKGWYYNSLNSRSPSWSSVFYFQNYILNNQGIGPFGHVAQLNDLEIGDLIQLRQSNRDFNHTTIIAEKTAEGKYLVCAHSDDSFMRDLEDYYFLELRGIKIDGIRIEP